MIRFQVGHDGKGLRVSSAVARNQEGLSVRGAKVLVDRGRVFVDGRRALKASMILKGGERVEFYPDTPLSPPDLCWDHVVWVGQDLIAVNKPPGLLVYGTRGIAEDTVIPRLKRLLQSRGEWSRKDNLLLVHRLDRDTSGLLLVARNAQAARSAEGQFFRHEVEKRYKVLAQGVPGQKSFRCASVTRVKRTPGSSGDSKKTEPPRGSGRKQKGKEAVTAFRVLESLAGCALLEARPFTGHTHQIRIHLEEAGHPVLGDILYGPGTVRDARFRAVPRQMLHAASLEFADPGTGERVRLRAPVPRDMEQALSRLRKDG